MPSFTVNAEVEIMAAKYLCMKMHVGTGQVNDMPVEYSLGMGTGDPMLLIDGKMYRVSIQSIIIGIVEQVVEDAENR
jgi:hypothetical protein